MKTSAWQLVRPYWFSEQKWIAITLLITVISLDFSNVYFVLQITHWQKDFFDALSDYKLDVIKPLLLSLLLLVASNVTVRTFSTFFEQLLLIRWRSWLTNDYVKKWLSQHHFYHIEQQHLADNPDQRISEDLGGMAEKTLSLFTGLIKNSVNLVSYAILIWTISDTWLFSINGTDYTIPGAMLWAAILYALLGSYIMEKIGRSMISLDYKQQQYEANFRALLMNIRKNAEQIALYKGQRAEDVRLQDSFSAIRQNWHGIMTYTKRIAFTESIYMEVGGYLPYFLVVPQYFAKKITIGGVMQLSSGFARLRASLSWFVYNYKEISALRAIFQRLGELHGQLNQQPISHIQINDTHKLMIKVEDLIIHRPNGELLVKVEDFTLTQGERLIIQGASGCGKSTLLRVFAKIWQYGTGIVELPQNKILFLPQKPYLAFGHLKAILCYPQSIEHFSDDACIKALTMANLSAQAQNLHQEAEWERILSTGEQQRLAFAKIFLQQPDVVLLDEATSALDQRNETQLYQKLIDSYPHMIVISVAHHQNLVQFHHQTLNLGELLD